MLPQTVVRTGNSREKFKLVQPSLLVPFYRVHRGFRYFLAKLMIALDKSRQREADRILRQYRDLIDK